MLNIQARVKNESLLIEKRNQIIDAAVKLFSGIGFQKTTTRLIAREAGVSIGSLYEYINSKEDLLHLICESIHLEMAKALKKAFSKKVKFEETLSNVIREYFLVCNEMSDRVVLMYKITQFLQPDRLKMVIDNELIITDLIVREVNSALEKGAGGGRFGKRNATIVGHNIVVLGQMWAFRRWFLAKRYTIEEYIQYQTEFIQSGFTKNMRFKLPYN